MKGQLSSRVLYFYCLTGPQLILDDHRDILLAPRCMDISYSKSCRCRIDIQLCYSITLGRPICPRIDCLTCKVGSAAVGARAGTIAPNLKRLVSGMKMKDR